MESPLHREESKDDDESSSVASSGDESDYTAQSQIHIQEQMPMKVDGTRLKNVVELRSRAPSRGTSSVHEVPHSRMPPLASLWGRCPLMRIGRDVGMWMWIGVIALSMATYILCNN